MSPPSRSIERGPGSDHKPLWRRGQRAKGSRKSQMEAYLYYKNSAAGGQQRSRGLHEQGDANDDDDEGIYAIDAGDATQSTLHRTPRQLAERFFEEGDMSGYLISTSSFDSDLVFPGAGRWQTSYATRSLQVYCLRDNVVVRVPSLLIG